jgi:signal transduction histidine kinase
MEDQLRILLLEDVAEEGILIERAIRKENIKFSCKRVDTREQYREALDGFRPHIILSDHALPQFNSIEALKMARAFESTIPFILVTGTVSEEFAVACLKQGASDYVLKSNLSRLPNSIRHALMQREAEEKKRAAEEELKEQNEKLSHSNRELHKSHKELDNFVYSVSHNLRGPLSSILGIVNLSRISAGIDASELFGKIEESVNKLEETLEEILNYSRNSRYEVFYEETDLRAIFEENCMKLQFLPHTCSHATRFTQSAPGKVMGDLYRINLIVHNILSNSFKYCDESKGEMHVRMNVDVTPQELTLTFEDNGSGISPEAMPKIFNMFYRGNEKSDGAGLGLYIVKEAVEKLRGTIDLRSVEGTGTSVTIKLPAHAER